MRVRGFTQDDAHIFCTEDQVTGEAIAFCELLLSIYRDFGFDDVGDQIRRPAAGAGRQRRGLGPRRAAICSDAVEAAGLTYTLNPGEGAFYGPKLEFVLARRARPRLAMRHACSSISTCRSGSARAMSARMAAAIAGHAAPRDPRLDGALHRHPDRALRRPFPAVAGAGAGRRRLDHLRGGGLCRGGRAANAPRPGCGSSLDTGNEKINYKVREHSLAKVPIMLVVGRREAANRSVALRRLGGKEQEALALGEAVARLKEEAAVPSSS